jgi:hypothetical protein
MGISRFFNHAGPLDKASGASLLVPAGFPYIVQVTDIHT